MFNHLLLQDPDIIRLNILVIGAPSSGKRTFLKSLLSGHKTLNGDLISLLSPLELKKFDKSSPRIEEIGSSLLSCDGDNSVFVQLYDFPHYANNIDNRKAPTQLSR